MSISPFWVIIVINGGSLDVNHASKPSVDGFYLERSQTLISEIFSLKQH